MGTVVAHNFDWENTQERLASRSAEETLFDTIGGAVMQYAKEKAAEAEEWKNAYNNVKAQNEYLVSILRKNGIEVPDLSWGIPLNTPCVTDHKNSLKFCDLIQGDNKNDILLRLHNCIDGKGGKDVAAIMLRAKDDRLISRLPNEKEFRSEFSNITTKWRAISTYLNPNHYPDYSSVKI